MDLLDELQRKPLDAVRLTQWTLTRSMSQRVRCMRLGGVLDVTQETIVNLLLHPPAVEKRMAFSTVVCNQARWTLYRMTDRLRRRIKVDNTDGVPDRPDMTTPGPDHAAALSELRTATETMLATLDPRHRVVLEMRFGLGDGWVYTLSQAGVVLGITRERVRQIELLALGRLTDWAAAHTLTPPPNGEQL